MPIRYFFLNFLASSAHLLRYSDMSILQCKRLHFLSLIFSILLFSGFFGTVSAQVDFREESIYFLLTARFYDGDPSNNVPNEWSSYHPDPNINPDITDPNDVTYRGDFKGIIDQLDYIQDLGFTAIWITPIVQNRSPLDYHGYHAWDFTKVDPRLESDGVTFQTLIDSVHARGMKIILDIVTNHSGRFGIKGQAELKYNSDPNQPWGQDANGDTLTSNPNWEYDGITPNPDDGKIWSRANVAELPAPYNENLAAYNWPNSITYVETSDPDWFHHSGNGFAQGFDDVENLQNRALHEDTPDLNTGSQAVRDYLINAYGQFIEMGVDGFRWDTIKHMSREDVLYLLDEFKKINPDLFIFGEVAQKRHELLSVEETNPHWYTWRGTPNQSEPSGLAIIDFFAMSTFHLFEKGEAMSGVQAAARYDHLYSDPSTNVTFLDNHDFGPNNDWNRRFGNSPENLTAAMNFMFTWRGIPSFYYGTEIQFMRGAYADIQYGGHQQSLDITGRAYYGDNVETAHEHRVYQHIKKLNAMRRAIPALQKGNWRWDGNGGGNGVGYVREYQESYAVVGLAKDGSVNFNFSGLQNGTYRDAVTGHEVEVTNGSLNFTVAPSSAGIYVLDGPGLIGDLGAGFFQTDANGSQGSGGNGGGSGGNQSSASLSFDPASPVPGESVTVIYDGFLNDESSVNMYWGYDSWNGITTTAMSKNGEFWTVTVTVPSQATSELNIVFNNGNQLWDNNNENDYQVSLSNSSGGGGNQSQDGSFTWTPENPRISDPITITLQSTENAVLHWGVNNWQRPSESNWPGNSNPDANSDAVRTNFVVQGESSVIQFSGFNESDGVQEINFVIHYPDRDFWDNNNSNDYRITLSTATSVDEFDNFDSKPAVTRLLPNYPNPFNPTTTIPYELGAQSQVKITVTDLLGREVTTLVNGRQSAGSYQVQWNALNQSTGIYFIRLETGDLLQVQKITLIK